LSDSERIGREGLNIYIRNNRPEAFLKYKKYTLFLQHERPREEDFDELGKKVYSTIDFIDKRVKVLNEFYKTI